MALFSSEVPHLGSEVQHLSSRHLGTATTVEFRDATFEFEVPPLQLKSKVPLWGSEMLHFSFDVPIWNIFPSKSNPLSSFYFFGAVSYPITERMKVSQSDLKASLTVSEVKYKIALSSY